MGTTSQDIAGLVERMDLAQFEGHAEGPWACGSNVIEDQSGRPIVTSTIMMTVANARLMTAGPAFIAEIRTLRTEVERLREALTFYRDGFQYHPKRTKTGINLSEWKPTEALLDDCGERARAALKEARS